VIPLFHEQIKNGGPVTITTEEMTRFLLPLDKAVDTIIMAMKDADPGETFIPKVPSCRMIDLAKVLIDGRKVKIAISGIRPGEKIHEILISEEEAGRAVKKGDYYAIRPLLPEILKHGQKTTPGPKKEYSSGDNLMSIGQIKQLMKSNRLMIDQDIREDGEFLR
jgi:UDP-glucose 4-epimerase